MSCLSSCFKQIQQRLITKSKLFYSPDKLSWIIIGLGIILRFRQYLFNRSLWLDEAYLAVHIVDKSFSELLFKPLLKPFAAFAPPGFLAVEKLLFNVFGNSEYVLRLFPFFAGIISLFLFYRVAKRLMSPKVIPIALIIFAVSGPLIYYSSEVKQYSSDVFIALLLYLATLDIRSKGLTVLRVVKFSIIGAVAIWFSHPAVFILAGVGTSLTLFSLKDKEWSKFLRLLIVCSVWIFSFVIFYFVSLQDIAKNESLINFFGYSYMPLPPTHLWEIRWFIDTFYDVFKNLGIFLYGIAALVFLIGCYIMFSEKKVDFSLLITPTLFALLASGLHRYPFTVRFLLFTAPSIILFIAAGVGEIIDKTRNNSPAIGIVLVVLLLFDPLYFACFHLMKPRTVSEIRPVINYVRKHALSTDLLYLYYGSESAFKYYSNKYGFNKDYLVAASSISDWRNYVKGLDNLRGEKRVWVIFANVYKMSGVDEEKLFLLHLDCIGTKLVEFKSEGAAAYLYDLNK
jgi:hypothetical protein